MTSAAPSRLAQLDDGRDDVRVGVDDLVAVVLDQVRLEHDALARERHARAEVLVLPAEDVGEVGVVVADRGDVDLGSDGGGCAGLRGREPTTPRNVDLTRSPSGGFRELAGLRLRASASRGRRLAGTGCARVRPARRQGLAAAATAASHVHGLRVARRPARMRSSSRGRNSATPVVAVQVEGELSPSRGVRGRRSRPVGRGGTANGRPDARSSRPSCSARSIRAVGAGIGSVMRAEDQAVAVVDPARRRRRGRAAAARLRGRGVLALPAARRARQAQEVGSTQEKLPSAHGQPTSVMSMSHMSATSGSCCDRSGP